MEVPTQDVRERATEHQPQPDGPEKGPGRDVVDKLAEIPKGAEPELTGQQSMDAADWFLSEDSEDATDSFELNVGVGSDGYGKPNELWVIWTVRALDRERIRQIRKNSREKRRRGPGGEGVEDDMQANLRIATDGTVYPDLTDPMMRGNVADPAEALHARFKRLGKSGLIDQIASRVLTISGYDDEDMREIQAAKNS
jgi:hypothetical protein